MSQFELPESLGLDTWRAAFAELIATLLFVFLGAGTVVVVKAELGGDPATDPASLVAVALAHGLAIATLMAATAKLSGGHINPAVTFAAVITGRMKLGPGILYICGQMIGAVIGATLLHLVLVDAQAVGLGATTLNDRGALEGTAAGLVVEIILTFVLVFTFFAVAIDPRGRANLAPIAIGSAVLIDNFIGVPLTGASMNPARSFGPALVGNMWTDDHWVYWVGPLVGGGAAGIIYFVVYMLGREED